MSPHIATLADHPIGLPVACMDRWMGRTDLRMCQAWCLVSNEGLQASKRCWGMTPSSPPSNGNLFGTPDRFTTQWP